MRETEIRRAREDTTPRIRKINRPEGAQKTIPLSHFRYRDGRDEGDDGTAMASANPDYRPICKRHFSVVFFFFHFSHSFFDTFASRDSTLSVGGVKYFFFDFSFLFESDFCTVSKIFLITNDGCSYYNVQKTQYNK